MINDNQLLALIPRGKKNRVSGWELQRVGGYKNICVFRDVIRRLRKNGELLQLQNQTVAAITSQAAGKSLPSTSAKQKSKERQHLHHSRPQGRSCEREKGKLIFMIKQREKPQPLPQT